MMSAQKLENVLFVNTLRYADVVDLLWDWKRSLNPDDNMQPINAALCKWRR